MEDEIPVSRHHKFTQCSSMYPTFAAVSEAEGTIYLYDRAHHIGDAERHLYGDEALEDEVRHEHEHDLSAQRQDQQHARHLRCRC